MSNSQTAVIPYLKRPLAQYQAFVQAAGMAARTGDLQDCARYVLAALDVIYFHPEIIDNG